MISLILSVIVLLGHDVWTLLRGSSDAFITYFSWVALRISADGAAGALEMLVYLFCFLHPVSMLAGIVGLW